MANKTAKIVWAVLTRNDPYTPHTVWRRKNNELARPASWWCISLPPKPRQPVESPGRNCPQSC